MCVNLKRLVPGISLFVAGAFNSYAADTDTGHLEEITVTARKVTENLQSTPIAITALSGESLTDHQVFDTTKLSQVVPNLQFSNNAPLAGNNSSSAVFIRGIGQTDPTSTVDPGVGMYIDEVYIGTAIGGTMTLRDIASVQVLRGPQGTLFGRNTIGGAILLTTTQPGDDFGGTARLGTGSRSLIDAFAAVDVPFTSTLKSRFSFGVKKQDGYVTRTDGTDLGDINNFIGLAKLLWSPTDWLKAAFSFDYSSSDEHGTPLVFAAINEAATFPRVASSDAGCPGFTFASGLPVPQIADNRCANDLQARGPYHNNGTAPLKSKTDIWGTSVNLTLTVSDELTLKSISAYRDDRWLGARDADNTPLTILHTFYDVRGSQWSQELQATYQTKQLTGVVGLYYFKQHSTDIATVELNPPPPGIQRDSDNNVVENESWAVFTQWTYNPTDLLSLTAGGRYTQDKKGSYPDQFDYSAPNVKQVPLRWYRDTFSSFTPSASVALHWTDHALTYLSYSQGFKGGGWNSHFNSVLSATDQSALQEFRPEKAKSIELGFKLDLLDNTLRLNGAVFNSDYIDMQLTYRGPAPNGVAPFVTNAGKTTIKGAELEVTWVPIRDLRIDGSVGYLEASIDRLDNVPSAILPPDLKVGNSLPFSPKWQAHLGVGYTIRAGNFEIAPRVDGQHQSRTFFDPNNTVEIAQLDDVTTLNVSASIGQTGGHWRATAGVNNVTDKAYPIAGNSSLSTGSGYAEIAYSKPREFFVSAKYDF